MLAVIDTNGDGRLLELDGFRQDNGGRWWPELVVGAGQAGEGELASGVSYRYELLNGEYVLEIGN